MACLSTVQHYTQVISMLMSTWKCPLDMGKKSLPCMASFNLIENEPKSPALFPDTMEVDRPPDGVRSVFGRWSFHEMILNKFSPSDILPDIRLIWIGTVNKVGKATQYPTGIIFQHVANAGSLSFWDWSSLHLFPSFYLVVINPVYILGYK